jgi:hypothetical protein
MGTSERFFQHPYTGERGGGRIRKFAGIIAGHQRTGNGMKYTARVSGPLGANCGRLGRQQTWFPWSGETASC